MDRELGQKLLNILGTQLQARGTVMKHEAVIAASVVASSRRARKNAVVEPEAGADEDEPAYGVNTTYSDDADAAWTVKAN